MNIESMKKKLVYLFCLTVCLSSCHREEHDVLQENYDELFPFEGIERPENELGDVVVKPCDPDAKPEDYVYPGNREVTEKDTYTVTLKYRFTEQKETDKGNKIQSRYVIKYIDKNEKQVLVCTDRNYQLEHPEETPDVRVSYEIKNHQWHTVKFTAYSGFPLMLCVTGTGPRDSSIEAEITAVSTSGLTPELKLETRQYQNKEGIDRLARPYGNYIVLP